MAENSNPNTQPAGPPRFKRLRLRIVILGVLVVIAFAGSSAYDAWRAYNNALAATNREITNVDCTCRANRLDVSGHRSIAERYGPLASKR
jgi:hypothetical protein